MTAPVRLAIETELDYTFEARTAVLLQIEAAMIPEQRVDGAHIAISPVQHFARIPGHDDIGDRIWLRTSGRLSIDYRARMTVLRDLADVATLPQMACTASSGLMKNSSSICSNSRLRNV